MTKKSTNDLDRIRESGYRELDLTSASDAEIRKALTATFNTGERLIITNGDRVLGFSSNPNDFRRLQDADARAREKMFIDTSPRQIPGSP